MERSPAAEIKRLSLGETSEAEAWKLVPAGMNKATIKHNWPTGNLETFFQPERTKQQLNPSGQLVPFFQSERTKRALNIFDQTETWKLVPAGTRFDYKSKDAACTFFERQHWSESPEAYRTGAQICTELLPGPLAKKKAIAIPRLTTFSFSLIFLLLWLPLVSFSDVVRSHVHLGSSGKAKRRDAR